MKLLRLFIIYLCVSFKIYSQETEFVMFETIDIKGHSFQYSAAKSKSRNVDWPILSQIDFKKIAADAKYKTEAYLLMEDQKGVFEITNISVNYNLLISDYYYVISQKYKGKESLPNRLLFLEKLLLTKNAQFIRPSTFDKKIFDPPPKK